MRVTYLNFFTTFTSKSFTLRLFIILLITIQYLRVQQPVSNLGVIDYSNQLCAGIIDSNGNIVTAAQTKATATFVASVSLATPDFGVQEAINNRLFNQYKLVSSLFKTSIVWMLFLLMSIIGCLSFVCCSMCPNKCPPCTKCRRDVQEKPYSKIELIVPSVFAIFFSLLVFSVGVSGLAYAPDVAHGILAMRCSFMFAFEQILQPQNTTQTNGFPGIVGIVAKLKGLKTQLNDLENNTTATFENRSAPIINASNQVLADLNNYNTLITYNQDSNSLPNSTQSFYANSQNLFSFMINNASANVQPGIIGYEEFQNINPEAQALRFYYDLMIGIIFGIENVTAPFLANANFSSLLDVAIAAAQNMTSGIEAQSASIYSWTQPMQTYASTVTEGIKVIFAFAIVTAVSIIVGASILLFFKKFQARYYVHIGWCFYCVFMILGFFTGSILNPVGIISLEFCDYVNGFLTNKEFFTSSFLVSDLQTKAILQECFFNKGDILSIMNMTSPISSLTGFVGGVGTFTSQLMSVNITSQQMLINSYIQNDTGILNTLSNGTMSDYDPTDSSSSSIAVQIYTMNQYSAGTHCKELAQVNCTDNSIPSSWPLDGSTPSSAALSMQCWHPSLLVAQNNYVFCANQTIIAAKLKSWFTQQNSKWSGFVKYQNASVTAHNKVDQSFQAYLNSIYTYVNNTNSFIDYNTNNKTGILVGINCIFLSSVFAKIYDALCVLFVPAAFRSSVLILLISLSMFFGSLSSFCVGFRFFKMSNSGQDAKIAPFGGVEDSEKSKLKQSPSIHDEMQLQPIEQHHTDNDKDDNNHSQHSHQDNDINHHEIISTPLGKSPSSRLQVLIPLEQDQEV